MPVYVFRGRNTQTNENVSGERFSTNSQSLAATLRQEQIMPASIREKKERQPFSIRKRVSQTDVAIFTRQFSIMLDAGIPLVQCLQSIADKNPNPHFGKVLEQVRGDVEAGATLSDAMARHPKVFDNLFTSMIAAGETGGILDTILQRLAVFIE
jgi:type IV pilus assembly protein PilC